MRKKNLRVLVFVNVMLLLLLAVVSFAPKAAQAQFGGARAGEYMMVSGRTPGKTQNTIYVMDVNRGIMRARMYNISSKAMDVLGVRNIQADFQGGGARKR